MVPENNETWALYIKLREIIHIITSPTVTSSHLAQLKILIEEHHTMYLKLFGPLKAKFHFMLHYVRLILQNGPLIKTSSMRSESKHRIIKAILNPVASNRNILLTAGIKLQLSLIHYMYSQYQHLYMTYGSEVPNDSVNIYFPKSNSRKTVNNVKINDVTYESGTIIVANILEKGPLFEKIKKIFIVDNSIFFEFVPLRVIGFNMHVFAFSVLADEQNQKIVHYDSIAVRTPCLSQERNDISYVFLRHVV